jgi:hypothetical protein
MELGTARRRPGPPTHRATVREWQLPCDCDPVSVMRHASNHAPTLLFFLHAAAVIDSDGGAAASCQATRNDCDGMAAGSMFASR